MIVENDTSDILSKIDQLEPSKISGFSSRINSVLNQYDLSGFIEKDEATGKIEIKGFTLSIVGLTTEFEQKIPFVLGEWRTLLTNIKYYSEPLKNMIGNYKASQEERISKRKLVKFLQKYEKYAKSKLKNNNAGDVLRQKSLSKIIKKIAANDKDSKRYLFELSLPKVFVTYMHHDIEMQLMTEDVEHLCNTQFQGWKKYILHSLFRMEFNIHDPLPDKITDKYLSDMERKRKKVLKLKSKSQKNQNENTSSENNKSEESKSELAAVSLQPSFYYKFKFYFDL